MPAAVSFTLPDGACAHVPAGGLIGRLPTASLRLADPRISEAHAMVSLRGSHLVLVALRGSLKVGRTPMDTVQLSAGRRVELAPNFAIEVGALELPTCTLALAGLGPTPVELVSEIATLYPNPWRLEPGYDPSGRAHISATGDGWSAHVDGVFTPLAPGVHFVVDGQRIEGVEVPLDGLNVTLRQLDAQRPMRLVARYETFHIVREDCQTVVLSGMSAKILTELVRYASPAPWEWIARELFGTIPRHSARMRWDRNLKTLRRKLREGGIRGDLAFSDGHGNIELVIGARDTVVDES